MSRPNPTSAPPAFSHRAIDAVIVMAAVAGLATMTLSLLPPLFLGRDLAVIAVAWQLPWVGLVVAGLSSSTGRLSRMLLGTLVLLVWMGSYAALPTLDRGWFAPLPGAFVRAAFAGGLLMGWGLLAMPDRRRLRPLLASPLLSLVVITVAAIVPPAQSVHSRCEAERRRVTELLDQSRIAEAARTLDRLAWCPTGERIRDLDPQVLRAQLATTEDQMLRELVTLEQQPDRIATAESRARLLAMLGDEPAALAVLATVPTPSVELQLLWATILETQQAWSAARAAYQSVLSATDADAVSVAAAWRGLGYCERKLGNPTAAENALLKLLALQPTADTHFLLGQFYEDAQQAGPARQHLERAAALDPTRYREPTELLLRRLRRAHFGCGTTTSR